MVKKPLCLVRLAPSLKLILNFQIVRIVLDLKLVTYVPMLENVLKTFANVMTSSLGTDVNLDVRISKISTVMILHTNSCFNLAAIPGQEVVMVGGTASQMFYSGVANQAAASDFVCTTTSNYATVSGTSKDQVCDYVFGRGICCLGLTTADATIATDTCFYWDCFTRSWLPTNNVPAKLTSAAANPIRQDGRDEYWIIAGGVGMINLQCE